MIAFTRASLHENATRFGESACRLRHGPKRAGIAPGEVVERSGSCVVGRDVDDEALIVSIGQLHGLERDRRSPTSGCTSRFEPEPLRLT